MWSSDTRFKRTEISKFPVVKSKAKTEDAEYWKYLQQPVTIREYGPVQNVDVCLEEPYFVAITGSSRVQIINPATNAIYKTLSKFRETALGGKFRYDGKLLSVGSNDGSVKIFDVSSKTLLRTLSGHKNATHAAEFMDNKRMASFSDDKTVRTWDISTEEQINCFEKHTDYIRAGCISPVSSDILVSGSYDHSINVWDTRQSCAASSIHSMVHGYPVEAVKILPNGTLLVTAGGSEVKIWDLLAGGRLLKTISTHNKTVTSLALATNSTRLVTASLDRHLKFHDLNTFETVHTIPFPSPILSAGVSPNDGFISVGMSDGLVQFLHRKVPPSFAEREAERLRKKPSHRYLQYTHFETTPDDIIVKEDVKMKESKHDYYLRKFEYSKALDQVLKPYVAKKYPQYTYSLLRELERRNGLQTAISGRNEKQLLPLLQFLHRQVTDPRFSTFLISVIDMTIDVYASSVGTSPEIDKVFKDISKRVDREARSLRQLMMLQGALDLVLTASRASDKPSLTKQEVAIREKLKKDKDQYSIDTDLCLYKSLMQ